MSGIIETPGGGSVTASSIASALPSATAAEVATMADEIVREAWVFEGDSWSAGTAQGNDRETWPFYLNAWRSRLISTVNVALAGSTAQTMVSTFAATVAPHLTVTTGRPSTCFIFAGINDAATRTTTQLRDDLRSLWTAARNAGARVVAFTLPERTAGGGWSAADWATINAQIISDASYYDVLVRADIVFGCIAPESSDGLHVNTAAHAKLASRVLEAMEGRQVMPSLPPDSVAATVSGATLTANTRRNLGFSALYENNGNFSAATVGSDANTTVFTAPCAGTYEIAAGLLVGGLTLGDTVYLTAWITPISTGTEVENRVKWVTAAGANEGIEGTIRRRLSRGDKVSISIHSSRTGSSVLTNPNFSVFAVRLASIP